jgi:hypothetical protein
LSACEVYDTGFNAAKRIEADETKQYNHENREKEGPENGFLFAEKHLQAGAE